MDAPNGLDGCVDCPPKGLLPKAARVRVEPKPKPPSDFASGAVAVNGADDVGDDPNPPNALDAPTADDQPNGDDLTTGANGVDARAFEPNGDVVIPGAAPDAPPNTTDDGCPPPTAVDALVPLAFPSVHAPGCANAGASTPVV